MPHLLISQMMGFYIAAGLSMIMLPGMLMHGDTSGNVLRLRRVGQCIMLVSMLLLAVTLRPPV